MRTDTHALTRLADYRPSDYLVDRVELDIVLHPTATAVRSRLFLRPNPAGRAGSPLVLDGGDLLLRGLEIDGAVAPAGSYLASPESLTVLHPPAGPFELAIVTEVNPTANTKLMGLYRSGGVYCTQCEADGFRRISYFLDRPDVLAVYTTRIEADGEEAPVLLGNGNLVESGDAGESGRRYAVWHDPFPKPCYLFALVAGRLDKLAKPYRTAGGRDVEIAVWVEPGKADRAAYALDALERSMRWDERVFGRDYDLDVFNVVAVSDFNMGAMENKGLNIFNDKYVLASPETATDADYAGIETVIAHEYFHNWTGNRITCRDWFQLCLKEGLTVFRDQEFSSDERSRAVHRISEVRTLRARQFPEDAGPLAHPVRPTAYREINNFYTATVYEKGAEIVRMLKTLLGPADFARGMTLYFERFDGTAATVEDFLDCFATVSARDLGQFSAWYRQAGTPVVTVETSYDEASRSFRLDLAQETPPTPDQPDKEPLVIPVALGFLAPDGGDAGLRHGRIRDDGVLLLDQPSISLAVHDVPERPVPSVLRAFSAPVRLKLDLPDADLLHLLRHDPDPFNRWQSAQVVALRGLVRTSRGEDGASGEELSSALGHVLASAGQEDPAFAALVLTLPGEAEIAGEIGQEVDPDAIHTARDALRGQLGRALAEPLRTLRRDGEAALPYSPDAASAGRRSLRNVALDLLTASDPVEGGRLASAQLRDATNMSDRIAALSALSQRPGDAREDAFAAFAERYATEPLALDKWFALQAVIPEAGTIERVRRLMAHPAFSFGNPNRVRALIGAFAGGNPTQFHRLDGAGYDLLAEVVLALDGTNSQIAARLLTSFGTWRTMTSERRLAARASLGRIAVRPELSRDVADIVGRSLAEPPAPQTGG